MPAIQDIVSANGTYAATFDNGSLPMPPGRRLAIVTCMDARINTAAAFGVVEGDAHVIRNAGGRVSDDALRSLIISQHLLGTTAVVVIHHTDCGMLTFTGPQLREKVREELGADVGDRDFLTISSLEESVREDVEKVRTSPYLKRGIEVFGAIYDVRTGRVTEVV